MSEMLRLHPSVLSLSEVFASLQPRAFPTELLTGEAFYTLLTAPNSEWTAVLQDGSEPSELLYDADSGGRYTRSTGVPPLLATCLPFISDTPELVLDEIGEHWQGRPAASAAEHYQQLFDWLCRRLGCSVWVERSGGSLEYATEVLNAFPEARVLHLHRRGVDTAMAMSGHAYFRHRVRHRAGGDDETLSAYGRYWSSSILTGLRALSASPGGSVLHLSYERLVTDSAGALEDVARFFDLPDAPEWPAAASRLVEHQPSRWSTIGEEERAATLRATAVGERALRALSSPR